VHPLPAPFPGFHPGLISSQLSGLCEIVGGFDEFGMTLEEGRELKTERETRGKIAEGRERQICFSRRSRKFRGFRD